MSEWGITQLSDIASLMTDGNWIESKDQSPSGIRLLQVGNIGKGYYIDKADKAKYISAETFLRLKCTEVFADDVLISRLPDPIGRACIIPKLNSKAITAVDCTIIRILDDKCNKRYLLHFLSSSQYFRQIEKFAVGSTRSRISRTNLKSITLPLPPLPIQQKIAAILDKVNDLITERKQQLEKIDIMVKSRFVEMFGDPVENPMGWEVKRLDQIADSRLGKMLDAKKQTGENRFPYLANYNVQWFRFNLEQLNEMDFNEADRVEFALKYGDLLVCEGGEVGRTAIWRNEMQNCFFQKAVHRVRCKINICVPEYLAWVMYQKSITTRFDGLVTSATIAHLTGEKLKMLKIQIPPLSLQNRFADFVRAADKSKFAIEFAANKAHPLQIIAKEQ